MRHPGKYILAIILLALFTVLSVQSLYETGQNSFWDPMEMGDETFRAKFFSEELEEEDLSEACNALLRQVAGEIQYFPVPDSVLDPKLTTSYVNTWMAERSYGGKRGHEGIDIMADVQRPGLYPVVSMTDGVVTNLGWLEQGGYRIGITGDSGTYYYYAHLDSYGQVGKGERVRAGESRRVGGRYIREGCRVHRRTAAAVHVPTGQVGSGSLRKLPILGRCD